jgi:hypothetical protein
MVTRRSYTPRGTEGHSPLPAKRGDRVLERADAPAQAAGDVVLAEDAAEHPAALTDLPDCVVGKTVLKLAEAAGHVCRDHGDPAVGILTVKQRKGVLHARALICVMSTRIP